MYSARHQHIADLVFQNVLIKPEDRFDQIIRILNGMNIDYSSDETAFRSLIRGRSIMNVFSSYELGRRFYDHAVQFVENSPHLFQQRAVFEMNHPGGNLQKAEESLKIALDIAPYNKGIQHTFANLKRLLANQTNNTLLRDKLRKDSKQYLYSLARSDAQTAHGFHTLILVLKDQLRDLLDSKDEDNFDQLEEKVVVDLARNIESKIQEGQQRFPNEELLLTAEIEFLNLLKEDGRAFEALRQAFEKNPRSEWIAIHMSRWFSDNGEHDSAKDVLLRCAKANPGGKLINFALARFYMRYGSRDEKNQVLQLLRRSFSEGDTHFDAQYWYARELFLRGDLDTSIKRFSALKHMPISSNVRNKIRGLIRNEDGNIKRFKGTVNVMEIAYIFASTEEFPLDVFCHVSNASDDLWDNLYMGSSVEFEIGFSMRGPAGRVVSV